MTKQIWIVDDNADSRFLARTILSSDYELLELSSGEEALALLEERAPDLMLVDISMPGLSGFDVLAAIRSHHRLSAVPVIAYTARASKPERSGIVAFGFDGCVVKPIIHESDLLDPVADLLARPRLGAFAR
jgi:CheY-like chemotaxis protein